MKIERLKNDRIQDFFNYCRKHREEVADGCIQEQNLQEFKLAENPTYILTDGTDLITGIVSLNMNDYTKKNKKGRIGIFHGEKPEKELFELMLNKIKSHTRDLESLFIFIKDEDEKTAEIIKSIGFVNDGYSFDMIREDMPVRGPYFLRTLN